MERVVRDRARDCGRGKLVSFDFRKSNPCVYVGIGDNIDSSMDDLQWNLDFAVLPIFYRLVFPGPCVKVKGCDD
ncbi:hypothetical protein SDJN03_27452, partial [Cucurbita argyrosperma subsp. sororia]